MSWLFVGLQALLPHHLLGRLVYALSRTRRPWLKDLLIARFVQHYQPRLSEALQPDARAYDSFNAFFTRALRADARPIDPNPARLLSPCDGVLSNCGRVDGQKLLQAKGRFYTLSELLADAGEWTHAFSGGEYATFYLAPSNYHRVHMPLSGRLRAAWHVPGRLFSVNSTTAARVPRLFARNERVVCAFDGERGPFAVVLVGALFVGSMSTVWHGQITPLRTHSALVGIRLLQPATDCDLWQPRGAELGRFNMGSTVLLLLPPAGVHWDVALKDGAPVAVGQGLGSLPA
ncbi:MAG TPA: archaetidylserine decarboxylase [Steroidobacteraceae bacterium]|jgi:phosphatidylserine decarboxylase